MLMLPRSFRHSLVLVGLFPMVSVAVPPPPPEACGPEATLLAVRRSPEMLSWSLLALDTKDGKNGAYSGLSLAGAIALAKAGASGEVAAELQRLLGIPPAVECGPTALAGAWKATVDALAKADPSVTWKLASGAWLAREIEPKKLWMAMAKGEFDAEIARVNFAKQAVHTTVNRWVKRKTAGKIDRILDQPLDANTAFVLANALYFDAAWSMAFPVAQTKDATFRGVAGSKNVPMMEVAGQFAYAASDDGAVVRLPYGKADAYEMAVWLPTEGKNLSDAINEAGRQALGKLLDATKPAKGTVRLPRFRVDAFAPNLTDALEKLGAKKTFAFTRDWTMLAPDRDIRVSRVAHRVVVDVSERGTTVAAASAIVGTTRTAMIEKRFLFQADRPFVYLVRHRPTNVWVAVGTYQAP